ncbi:MAG: PH domain-containing protein [Nanoarchaeota archaeon]|nr:PH domain-containing protein [Nanoarchaeota archaeon]
MIQQQNITTNNTQNGEEKPQVIAQDSIILKPSVKPLLLSIVAGILLILIITSISLLISYLTNNYTIFTVTISIIGYIVFISSIGGIASIVDLLVTTYTITNKNELIITKEFISKTSKVYRIDQITSLERSQTFIQKIFNLHSIEFNIFGGVGVQNTGQSNNKQPILPIFKHISEGDTMFNEITSRMKISYNKAQYKDEPNLSPQVLSITLTLVTSLILFISIFFVDRVIESTQILNDISSEIYFSISIFLIVLGIIFTSISISKIIILVKLSKMNFELFEQSAHINYHYFFKNSNKLVPYKKITNSSEYKKLIPYTLFKVSDCVIYTGGNKDPRFKFISNDSLFIPIISSLVKDPNNILDNHKISTVKEELYSQQPLYTLKPGLSYIVQPLIPISFFIKLFILYIFIEIPLIENSFMGDLRPLIIVLSSLYIFIYMIYMIYRLIAWNNFKYELFYNKLMLQQGVFNIARTEIYISNIKYISLYRPVYLQRIFKEGTIIIFTAGKESYDGVIRRIRDSEFFYEELSKAISEK